MSITEILLTPRAVPSGSFPARSSIKPEDVLVLEGERTAFIPIVKSGFPSAQWYVWGEEGEVKDRIVQGAPYDKYKLISSLDSLTEYKQHLVSIFESVLEDSPASDLMVSMSSANKKLNIIQI